MFTAEEQQAIDNLSSDHQQITETVIKQVDGGYIIQHTVRFVTMDIPAIIVGQYTTTQVAATGTGVSQMLTRLYGLRPASDIVFGQTNTRPEQDPSYVGMTGYAQQGKNA